MFSRFHTPTHLILPALAASVILTSGGVALTKADPRGAVEDLFPGTFQRLYEDRFEEALPMRKLAQQSWTALRMAAFGEAQQGALIGTEGWLFTMEEFMPPADAPDLRAELVAARDQFAAAGVRLVPVIVPDKARIMADQHSFPRSDALRTRFDRTLALLADLDLPAIDARPALAGLGQAAFLRTDTHWSPEGARAVAQTVARHDPALVDLAGGYSTRVLDAAPFQGDLMRFADAGPFAAWVGPAPEQINAYDTRAADTGLGLFGEARIPVALIGTSFSARADLHFDGFLKSALGQDVLNLAQEGEGPFTPMRRALSDAAFLASLPDVVIWEIPERYIDPRTLP